MHARAPLTTQNMTLPIVAFVGRSGSGKTTLLVQVIAELSRRGYRVATIKHHLHSNFQVDQPGKDSWRHAQAGSRHVVIAAPGKIASIRLLDRELSLEEIATGIPDVDIVLAEGYKLSEVPMIEVVRAANSPDVVGQAAQRIALVTDMDLDLGVPRYALDDANGVADLIEARFLKGTAPRLQAHQAGRSGAERAGDGAPRTSFTEALDQTLHHVSPLGNEEVDLEGASGRVAAQDLAALVDCPSVDASLRDGYAVRSAEITGASPQHPVQLRLDGLAVAGRAWAGTVRQGMAVRALTGAPIPRGADAVVSDEFTTVEGDIVTVTKGAEPGRNILRRGSDVAVGQRIVATGELLRPTQVGLLAAAGHGQLRVFRRPRVAIVATGDEVVAPGSPLPEGKLYASNLVTLASWCTSYGMAVTTAVVPDSEDRIRAQLQACLQDHDAILTSGGAWTSERDLVVHLLDELGWARIYHRVRIGPGKAVAFGLLQGKPVFCLPGGPSSNHMAFLQLALPALHRLEGRTQAGLPIQAARLAQSIQGQKDWTQFVHGCLERSSTGLVFQPLRMKSRLQEMAQMEALVQIPEGTEWLEEGATVLVQVLVPDLA
jgi:molybdopterin molybdotransferase